MRFVEADFHDTSCGERKLRSLFLCQKKRHLLLRTIPPISNARAESMAVNTAGKKLFQGDYLTTCPHARVAEFGDYLSRRVAQRVDIKPKPFRASFGERVTLHSVKD
jgi:hypothetical protein